MKVDTCTNPKCTGTHEEDEVSKNYARTVGLEAAIQEALWGDGGAFDYLSDAVKKAVGVPTENRDHIEIGPTPHIQPGDEDGCECPTCARMVEEPGQVPHEKYIEGYRAWEASAASPEHTLDASCWCNPERTDYSKGYVPENAEVWHAYLSTLNPANRKRAIDKARIFRQFRHHMRQMRRIHGTEIRVNWGPMYDSEGNRQYFTTS